MSSAEIAQRYGTSTELSDWRISMTGIDRGAEPENIETASRFPAVGAKTAFMSQTTRERLILQ
jgi:hypothetical protein